ncbi:MAG: hypothetical protein JZD40_04385 [Sulfolobus sp.]|nr:hypothetical protein [Sulfolobus sp.]
MEALFNEILSSVNAHLKIFDEMYGKVESRFVLIHLAAAIEEFSKYIFLYTFSKCKHYMIDKYELPGDFINFFHSLIESIEKLDKDHRFKYLLFLTFYYGYERRKREGYLEITTEERKDIERDTEEITKLRNLYMTNVTEKRNFEINENFIKELRGKLNYLLQNRDELETTIASSCDPIILSIEKTWKYLKRRK